MLNRVGSKVRISNNIVLESLDEEYYFTSWQFAGIKFRHHQSNRQDSDSLVRGRNAPLKSGSQEKAEARTCRQAGGVKWRLCLPFDFWQKALRMPELGGPHLPC